MCTYGTANTFLMMKLWIALYCALRFAGFGLGGRLGNHRVEPVSQGVLEAELLGREDAIEEVVGSP